MSYNAERPIAERDVPETQTGGLFSSDFQRHDDLKTMLDSSKDNLKLDAMKRMIGMMADGRDISDLFAAVVKNVVSKNVEVKKLVYLYLVRYAEEQQDLALLSISTFQKGLKDPNQLIRGSALRVLSSIRVPVIAPIMMLAIKEGVSDMSPYVRKTAAHAIPKLYSLDPEQKDYLIEVIEKLLKDKTTLVAGSAVMAFEEVCPERIDLIHKNYRKLCNLLIDIDEWGQVAVIHMLTRYARTQFLDPNKEPLSEEFYPKSDNSEESENSDDEENPPKKQTYVMDPDHRLLLRSCKPLLQSRNSAVVMAVARVYHHLAPENEIGLVARSLVRLLRSHREVQTVVLSNIATMSAFSKGMFEPYLKGFFVHSNDPTHICLLKLEIMTNIAGETSIGTILREFQSYISSADKQFVASTIQAIGRCASNISEVTDTCLAGLVRLLSNRDEVVVAESVVVIKKLLQLKPKGNSDIIMHMAKLVDSITVPMARASILWLLGEYCERVPKVAPDVLRKMAKSFGSEEDIVKLQILNLGAKLFITNPKQTKLLGQYVLNLAKYDQSYDVRDRARFLRQLLIPNDTGGHLSKYVKKIFLASKPPPVIQSVFKDRQGFQVGSLSHMINLKATGYQELPSYPEEAPDPSVREVEVLSLWEPKKKNSKGKKSTFYSDSESGTGSQTESDSGSDSDEETETGTESDDEDESKSESESSTKTGSGNEEDSDESDEKFSDESDTESSEETSDSESEEERAPVKKPTKSPPKASKPEKLSSKTASAPDKGNTLLILDDLDETASASVSSTSTNILSPSLASEMESLSLTSDVKTTVIAPLSSSFSSAKSYELLHRMQGKGLSGSFKFTRGPCIYGTNMVAVEVTLVNNSDTSISNIHVGEKKLASGMSMHEFQEVASLARGATISVTLGIDFNDTTQPANFNLCTLNNKFPVSIKAPVGELLQGCPMSEADFLAKQGKLRGLNENSGKLDIPADAASEEKVCSKLKEAAAVSYIGSEHLPDGDSNYRFASRTISGGTYVLVTVNVKASGKDCSITVNCEKMAISSMLVKEIKLALQ
ncbi:AP-3 complex subunit beta-2-like [Acropora millepora]|uniref:AP-3 complex subunit beta-2-like n=1 Tax=Acropora millepora TaxID=45264 RepID=UPI001CF1A6B3|nr:AP-3 complex subunit beta-2-like [Acropora millepora]